MRPERPVEGVVDIEWHSSTTTAADALADHARSLLGPGVVTSGRLCPGCGSAAHGRPWLRHDGVLVAVSLARSGPHLVTAIGPRGHSAPIGVDVEVEDVAVRPELVLAPSEAAGQDGDLARAWARKEAILKARGTGLATPMSAVVLAEETWWDLPSPEGYVAALALASRVE